MDREISCWIETDPDDDRLEALCVETDHGVDSYAPLKIGGPFGTPQRQSVDVFYREPHTDILALVGVASIDEGQGLAEAIVPCVVEGFDEAVDLVDELHRQGWVLTDGDTMQMALRTAERSFSFVEVDVQGLFPRVVTSDVSLDDIPLDWLEDAARGYYGQEGRTALEGLAAACEVPSSRYGDDDFPYLVLAEIAFESRLADHHSLSVTRRGTLGTFEQAAALAVTYAVSKGRGIAPSALDLASGQRIDRSLYTVRESDLLGKRPAARR